ncbi:hypothetical protein DICVIV_11135 [Dictyocaulus viviparus]|uniref:Uncharacterized protein n=1 Tax=Dictyocaulus viviparus TaxID=29172 RepID=A0A0D8XGK2_DICVI|nr:hypothetical protein DICVIV_11135 [Dictyocaulus viviparus]
MYDTDTEKSITISKRILLSSTKFLGLITAGGGSIAVDNCWRLIKEKPCKAADLVSLILIANGEDLSVHNIDVDFIKQMLLLRIPVLYEEIIGQILHNTVTVDYDVMLTHAFYYWCNEHFEKVKFSEKEVEQIMACRKQLEDNNSEMSAIGHHKLSKSSRLSSNKLKRYPTQIFDSGECFTEEASLLEEMEMEIKESQYAEAVKIMAEEDDSVQQLGFVVEGLQYVPNSSTSEDISLFEIIDLDVGQNIDNAQWKWSDGVSALSHLVPKALARSGVESASLSKDLQQYFESIIVELAHNFPTSFIHDFICLEAVNSIRCSIHPLLLPSYDNLSLMFCNVAKPEFGQQFEAGIAVYRLLMFLLYQYPPCNAEGRFYWLQVLTSDFSKPISPICDEQHGPPMKGSSLLLRVAGFRAMVLETFTGNVRNHNLMELLVSVLEIDLFNIEGCGGLDTTQKIIDDDDCTRSPHVSSCTEGATLLEQSQCPSALDGVPLSLLVFYDPFERRKRGLDKAAMETCFAIVNSALATNSIISANLCWRLLVVALEGLRFFLSEKLRLFPKKQISIDLQLDIERLGRYLFKKGLSMREIIQFVRVDWIYDIISAMM